MGVDADSEQRWPTYLRSVLAFSAVGVLLLYLLQRVQAWLPLDNGMANVEQGSAWNTAVSFVTNTNWQGYSGESTMGHLVQMAGLAVQNFLSAAVGIAVAIALVRGFARTTTDRLGNFWVDLTRAVTRVLLPISVVGALVLVLGGVVQNLSAGTDAQTLAGATQFLPGGPVASQEVIKELGTNGGGFFNANSAHPFEGPTAWVSLFQIFLLLLIPFALPRTFGRMVGDKRQGYAILGVMAGLATVSLALMSWFQARAGGTATQLAGAAMEGQEVRFGGPLSALFADATTLTSTGAINAQHDSFTPLGGGVAMVNMMLGEVAPGGVGSGLYGMLVLAVITVFVAGLMVGRTPEYLGKRLGRREMTLASLYILTTPALVLIGTAVAMALPAGPGIPAQLRAARALRGPVRVHLGGQQQRLGVRRPVGEHALLQRGARPGDGLRPVPADRVRARPRRAARGTGPSAGDGRHVPHPPPAVRRVALRRRPRRRRPHLLPGAVAGTARRRAVAP